MSWNQCELGDVLTLKRGYDLPTRLRKGGPVPVVSSSGITGYHNEAKVTSPAVVTGRYGTLGDVYYVDRDCWPLNTSLYVVDFKDTHPRFSAYFLRDLLRNYRSDKAAVPGVDRNVLHRLAVRVPDYSTQKAIASILSAYDNLIENNRRRIQLLERAARLLYKEWFVDFRFPGHERTTITKGVPSGWDKKHLFDIAKPTYGFSFKSKLFRSKAIGDGLPVARIRDIQAGASSTYTTEEAPIEKLLRDGDYVVGMDGIFHQNYWTGGKAWINQRVVRLKGIRDVTDAFLRYACQKPIQDLNKSIAGTTVAHLGAKHLRQVVVLVPASYVLSAAQELFGSVQRQVVTLAKEARCAAQARDLLLPRLMRGEITV